METRKNTPRTNWSSGRALSYKETRVFDPAGIEVRVRPFQGRCQIVSNPPDLDHWPIDIEETHPPTTASKAVRNSSQSCGRSCGFLTYSSLSSAKNFGFTWFGAEFGSWKIVRSPKENGFGGGPSRVSTSGCAPGADRPPHSASPVRSRGSARPGGNGFGAEPPPPAKPFRISGRTPMPQRLASDLRPADLPRKHLIGVDYVVVDASAYLPTRWTTPEEWDGIPKTVGNFVTSKSSCYTF